MHLKVAVESDRVQIGQPNMEIIAVDAFMNIDGFLSQPFIETSRFSDWDIGGNNSSRYYHLITKNKGCCLCLDSDGLGRLVTGIYASRELVLSNRRTSLIELFFNCSSIDDVINLFSSYSFVLLETSSPPSKLHLDITVLSFILLSMLNSLPH